MHEMIEIIKNAKMFIGMFRHSTKVCCFIYCD